MKILLMDSGFSSEPIYSALIYAGHEVWVIGNRKNDILAALAGSQWLNVDYSDIERVKKHLTDGNFDAIIPGCTDVSFNACVKIGKPWFDRDSPSVNLSINNKLEFRNICDSLNIPSPKVVYPCCFPRYGKFICKPVDGYSGRGASVFNGDSLDALQRSISIAKLASPTGQCVIESFHEGPLYSCSSFIKNQKVDSAFYVTEGSSANKFAVDTSYVCWHVDEKIKVCVEQHLNAISKALSLNDGLLHLQFIVSENNVYFIELTRRCPGDLYARLIELSTGFSYAESYANCFLGLNSKKYHPNNDRNLADRRYIVRHTVSADKKGIHNGLKFYRGSRMLEYYPISKIGDDVDINQKIRCGILFMDCDSSLEMEGIFNSFLQREMYSAV